MKTLCQNLWDAFKALIRGKLFILILLSVNMKKKTKVIKFSAEYTKQQQSKPKENKRKEIINIKAELMRETIEQRPNE